MTTKHEARPEFHKVEIDLPLDVADELIAKAGSVDAAVVEALKEYLRTDISRRNTVIRHVHSTGKSIASIAHIYAMSEEDIQRILG